VERVLLEHPAVLECAVAAIAGGDGIGHPRAFVVLRDGYAASAEQGEEMRGFLRARLAHHKVPHIVEFVAELAKTATGKIQRFKLRKLRRSPI